MVSRCDHDHAEFELTLHLQLCTIPFQTKVAKTANPNTSGGAAAADVVVGASTNPSGGGLPHVDPETQARLEALLEAAGIANLGGESKQLTDPEVRKCYFFSQFNT